MPHHKTFWYVTLIIAAFVSQYANAMVFDNRYLPLLQRHRLTAEDTENEFAPQFYMTTAKEALDPMQKEIPLGELFGQFDQVQLGKSIAKACGTNPFPSEFQGSLTKVPWEVCGKRQAQGVAFTWRQQLVRWLSTGFSWLFMRVNSRHDFSLITTGITPNLALTSGDAILLDENRRCMFSQVGIQEGNTAQLGFGDIDWYLRLGTTCEYQYRFRRMDLGFRVGALFPTGVKRDPNRPASIPFGGNGHWGTYVAADGMFELKEDWKVGFLIRVNKRFKKTQCMRVPLKKEPEIFGSTVTDMIVEPGITAILSPYVLFENLRDGFSLGLDFTLTWHNKDCFTDACCPDGSMVNTEQLRDFSNWSSEYFTLNILYDFGKTRLVRDFDPVLTFRWDIPSTLFTADRVDKAHRVSIGLDFLY